MEISGQGVSSPIQGRNHYVENSEAYTGKEPAAANGKSMLLNSLEPGSYVYGQVQSSSEDGAVLLLENGQKLLAKLAEGVNLVPGQNVTFQVERKQDGMVYMKPLFAEAALEMTAGKALQGAGFMSTPKNLEIVKELLELNMPVDRNTIRSMLQKSVTNPEVPIKQLALFEKLGIPVTKENMEQLKQYQASEHQIGKQMEGLLKELGEATEQLLMEGKTEEAVKLNQKVLDFLYEELSQQGQNPEGIEGEQADVGIAKEEAALKNPAQEAVLGELGEGKGVVGETVSEEGRSPVEEAASEGGRSPAGEMISEEGKGTAEQVAAGDGKMLVEEALPDGGKGSVAASLLEEGVDSRSSEKVTRTEENLQAVRGDAENANALKQDEIPLGTNRLMGNPEGMASETQEVGTREGSPLGIKEQMFELKELLVQTENPEELKKLLGSKKFQGLLERGMKEAWQMKPSEFNGKDSVNRSYARVEEQARLLGELLKESGAEGGSSLKTAANVQQNLEFMQDLNQVFPYIQLPLQMAGESAHGDLYVFKDKKKQHEAGEPFTAFLHLSMEHLGDVDVYLSLKEQKVATDITLEKESVLDLFEAHMDELIGRLQKKGYEVSAKLKISDKAPDFVEDILARQAGGSSVNRYSFDVKA